MPDTPFTDLLSGAATYGIALDNAALELFSRLSDLLTDWSTRTNLISPRDLDRLVTHHYLDSLKVCSVHELTSADTLMDFGSGAGFPGIPLAIAFPSCAVTLVDSRRLRCDFLHHAVETLGLVNVTVAHTNATRLPDSLDGAYACVITRATVSLTRFAEITGRFVTSDGALVAIKGASIGDEITAARKAGTGAVFNIVSTPPAHVPGVRDGSIVVFHRR